MSVEKKPVGRPEIEDKKVFIYIGVRDSIVKKLGGEKAVKVIAPRLLANYKK